MSHFAVAIITKGKPTDEMISKALAPYQENNMDDYPREYLEFNSLSKKYKEEYENETISKVKLPNGELVGTYNNCLYREISEKEYNDLKQKETKGLRSEGGWNQTRKYYIRDLERIRAEEVDVPIKQLYKSLSEYLVDWYDAKFDEEMQDYGYWENPNAKWDWYQIGGRYAGHIKVNFVNSDVDYGYPSLFHTKNPYESKENNIKYVDCARIKDIIIYDDDKYKKAIRFWELYIEGQEPQTKEDMELIKYEFYTKEYYLDKYKTKEKYAKLRSQFSTWAVITKDGQWHEAGTMGWFCISSATNDEELEFEENYKKFVFDNADEDDYLTLVDCHI